MMEKSMNNLDHIKRLLVVAYGVTAFLAGLDKTTTLNLLANWQDYLPNFLTNLIPFSVQIFLVVIGVIEMAAGILVFISPRKGFYLVSAWLVVIALNLLFTGHYYDIAVRDLVLSISAFAAAEILTVQSNPALRNSKAF